MNFIKGRTLEAGTKVEVYKNLHKDCYSVRDAKTGLVVAHTKMLSLVDVTFKVSQAGRKRVRFEKKKNVHAFIVGTYEPDHKFTQDITTNTVTYNPYFPPLSDEGYFYDRNTFEPLHKASEVYIAESGRVWYTK